MCAVDYDPATVHHAEVRTAAKDHRCGECRRTIAKGERYEHVSGLWDDNWSTYRTCAHCLAVRSWLEVVCHAWIYEGVFEDAGEHWSEGYRSGRFGRMLVGMRRGWRKRDGSIFDVPSKFEDADDALAGMPEYLKHAA